MKNKLNQYVWWEYLEEDLQELLRESMLLLDRSGKWEEKFHDYSFVVFPAAKAYEGFLKKLFLDMGFIDKKEFEGKRFRVGKALNPQLYHRDMKRHGHYRRLREKISVYDKLVKYCGGTKLANELWDTWKSCRNILFHWFPNERNTINLIEAEQKIEKIVNSMNSAFKECKIN